jgi:hypothetical protein
MSIADLKTRLADVPGIENLSMGLEAGRIFLRWGSGFAASADAAASDHEIEVAIRNASRLPPVSLIPDKPAPAPVPAAKGTAMSNPASAGLTVKAMLENHARQMGEIQQAQLRILESTLARQRDTVANAVGAVAVKLDAQTDEFLAAIGQFANDLG